MRNSSSQYQSSLEPSSPGKTVPVQKPSCSEMVLTSTDTIFLSVNQQGPFVFFLTPYTKLYQLFQKKGILPHPFGNVWWLKASMVSF